MAKEYGVNIAIKAIDAATAPIMKVQKRIDALFAPIKKVQGQIKRLGNAASIARLTKNIKGLHESLKKSWQEAGKLVGKLGLLGGGLLGGAVAGFRAFFLSVAQTNENLARSLELVTGSADGAKAALASIRASMRGLPVDINGATEAWIKLRAAGIEPTEDMLKRMAEVAGHTGKDILEVADVVAGLQKGDATGLAELLGGNVSQVGDYIVAEFTDATWKVRRMAVRQQADMRKNAAAMQALFKFATDAKGIEGGAGRFGKSWAGMLVRARSAWKRFVTLVMDAGPFNSLKVKFQSILDWFDELEASGGLQALAEEWARNITGAIDAIWEGGKAFANWLKADFLPAFDEVKEFLGGWAGIAKLVAVIMAGPFLLAFAMAAKSVIALGVAMLATFGPPLVAALVLATKAIIGFGVALVTTPIGWIIGAVALVGAAFYGLYKAIAWAAGAIKKAWPSMLKGVRGAMQGIKKTFFSAWNGITGFLQGKIRTIKAAFDQGFLKGLYEIFKTFDPASWIASGINKLSKYLFDIDLREAGTAIVNSILSGIKEKWEGLKAWLADAWKSLVGWMPKVVRKKLGVNVDPDPSFGNKPGGSNNTNAAAVMANGAAIPYSRAEDQKVRTEVVITGENLPPGLKISSPKSQADRTRMDLGYMMSGGW